MDVGFFREMIAPGVYFSSVQDRKFKHNRISVNFITSLSEDHAAENAALPFILRKGCRNLPDFTQLACRLSELYGADLNADISKYGGSQVLGISIHSIDDGLALSGESISSECARLLCDIVLDPKVCGDGFDRTDFETEQRYLIDTIEAQINDKRTYALNRCISIMCDGQPNAVNKYGTPETAGRLTPESELAAYRRIVRECPVEIMFIGCGSSEEAKSVFKKAFSELDRSPLPLARFPITTPAGSMNRVTEKMDIVQAKLVLAFKASPADIKDYRSAMRLFSAIYGGTPVSRLFLNVREKLSLCYYCAARYDHITGIFTVDSGIEPGNEQAAEKEILSQLTQLQKGEFDDNEIKLARLALTGSFTSVGDSLSSIEAWYFGQMMSGTCDSPAQAAERLDSVSRSDIIAAANSITLDTVYLLTSDQEVTEK